MLTNYPAFSNTSSHLSSPTVFDRLRYCWSTRPGTLNITLLAVLNNLILLPLCISVIHVGLTRWRRQRTPSSHCDIFTYHMVIVELMNVSGSTLSCISAHTDSAAVGAVGTYLFANVFSGQMLFHILTCAERYLAVVHPVTYLGLKSAKGIRLRNIVIGCVWLTCLIGMGYLSLPDERILNLFSFSMVPIAVVCISFCSISVLCVLMRPGPCKRGGIPEQVDQSKIRAFHTISVILSVLLMRFGGHICLKALYGHTSHGFSCAIVLAESWFCLPSSLVLPLLFLHRARKRPHCRDNK
ncbi:uncharacterized protein LOC110367369 [Fundulus heteroclitus]|uniref:uncharacterized protein LOC110367369 n=1 Tax=Fundulus heteroclitus TaxID=8078 RepID=UPI00165CB55F|nr:uncharacterized protein LOC110367369 [Fundulus heteroclitus]